MSFKAIVCFKAYISDQFQHIFTQYSTLKYPPIHNTTITIFQMFTSIYLEKSNNEFMRDTFIQYLTIFHAINHLEVRVRFHKVSTILYNHTKRSHFMHIIHINTHI